MPTDTAPDEISIPEYLTEFLTVNEGQAAYRTAFQARARSEQLYGRRGEALDALDDQVKGGLWQSAEVVAAIRDGRRDRAILRRRAKDLAVLCGGGRDLAIDYHWLVRGGPGGVAEADVTQVLDLLDKATPGSLAMGGTPPWIEALRLEAKGVLYHLWADLYLEQALPAVETVATLVRQAAAGKEPADPLAMRAAAACVQLYDTLGLPEQADAALTGLQAATGQAGGQGTAWWQWLKARAPAIWPDHSWKPRLALLIRASLRTRALRNPSDRAEINWLNATLQEDAALGVMPATPTPHVWEIPLPAAELEQSAAAAGRALAALPAEAARAKQILAVWLSLAESNLLKFPQVAALLDGVAPADEALGIMIGALLGEAQYRLADYEDAHDSLEQARCDAASILARAPDPPPAWLSAGRLFAARLAQLDGNALFFMGDDAGAGVAYAEVGTLGGDDTLLAATNDVNLGNLAYLRDNQVDQRGYVTLSPAEQSQLAEEGPAVLQAQKIARHAAGLVEAERCYRAALQRLAALPASEARRELEAIVHANLGNTAWAWGQVMDAEKAQALGELPLPAGWTSALVTAGTTPADAYQAAIVEEEQVLALAGDDWGLAATGWSNLAELNCLLGQATGDRSRLLEGLKAADKVTSLMASQRLTLPEGRWRAAHSRARLRDALGLDRAAEQEFKTAVENLQAMRAQIRLDCWQATFLQDKLEVYEDYISFLYRRHPRGYKARLFEVLEESKTQGFLGLLESSGLAAGSDDPELGARRDELLARIAALNEEMRRVVACALGDPAAAQAQIAKLAQQQQSDLEEWRDVQSEILAKQQGQADLNPRRVTLAEFQAFLSQQRATALSFFLGRRHSYLMAIDARQARVFELAPRRDIELAVTRLAWHCQDNSFQSFDSFWRANAEVVRLLLGPLRDTWGLGALRKLTGGNVAIIPDGVLFYLPFEALILDAARPAGVSGPQAYAAIRPGYWLSRPGTSINYVPSASTWMQMAGRRPEPPEAGVLAVYDVNYQMGTYRPPRWAMNVIKSLGNLPSTQIVGEIVKDWPSAVALRAWKAENEPEAPELQSTEDNFAEAISSQAPQAILFAGHATYNDRYPSLSGLIFNLAPVSAGAEVAPGSVGRQDGFLRLEEIIKLKMPATEIVFLAACQTALGPVYRGEGLNALTRAFLCEGSAAVVASLWAVEDKSTMALLKRFFESLRGDGAAPGSPGADWACLLAEAKRQAIQEVPNGQPCYWAPFVLTGVRSK